MPIQIIPEVLINIFQFLSREQLEKTCQLVSQVWNYLIQNESTLPLRSYGCLRLYAQKTARLTFYQPPAPAYQEWEIINFTRSSLNEGFEKDTLAKIKTLNRGKFRLVDIQCLDADFTPRLMNKLLQLCGCKILACKFQASKIEAGINLLNQFFQADKVQYDVYQSDQFHEKFVSLKFFKMPQEIYLRIWDQKMDPLQLTEGNIKCTDRYKLEFYKRNELSDFIKWVEVYKNDTNPTKFVRKLKIAFQPNEDLQSKILKFLSKLNVDKCQTITESTQGVVKEVYEVKKTTNCVIKVVNKYVDWSPNWKSVQLALIVDKF